MAHWCRICGCRKANEAFSGSGHKTHICKACKSLPAEVRDIRLAQDEVFGFLCQSNISPKNILRLRSLALYEDPVTAELAKVVLEVALIKPHKRRRLRYLAQTNPALLQRLEEAGLIEAHYS